MQLRSYTLIASNSSGGVSICRCRGTQGTRTKLFLASRTEGTDGWQGSRTERANQKCGGEKGAKAWEMGHGVEAKVGGV